MKIAPIKLAYNKQQLAFNSRIRMHTHKMQPKLIDYPNRDIFSICEDDDAICIAERTCDSFTGLRDKQYLYAVLRKAIKDAQCNNKNISIAMFDMDNFKSINELLDYETGDVFIKTTSREIDSVAKKYNLHTYRFGGEEFVIVFDDDNDNKKQEIVDEIIAAVNSNNYIKSKEGLYEKNAQDRLYNYSISTGKINALTNLKAKKAIYEDLLKNFTSDEAKNDPYFQKNIAIIGNQLNSIYLLLINDALKDENDTEKKKMLLNQLEKFQNNEFCSEEEQDKLEEYLRYRFDKSAEMFQIKKWLNDFWHNKGFSITGSVVSFKPKFIEDKSPMELVNIAGESLKKGKNTHKGRSYLNEV